MQKERSRMREQGEQDKPQSEFIQRKSFCQLIYKKLEDVFSGHISEDTLVLCDGLKSYKALEATTGCIVKDVTKETGSGFYNLNTVNSFHSFIKRQYEFYRGVATKYLNRYNALFSAAYKCTEAGLRQLMSSLLTVSGTRRSPSCRDIKTAGLLLI